MVNLSTDDGFRCSCRWGSPSQCLSGDQPQSCRGDPWRVVRGRGVRMRSFLQAEVNAERLQPLAACGGAANTSLRLPHLVAQVRQGQRLSQHKRRPQGRGHPCEQWPQLARQLVRPPPQQERTSHWLEHRRRNGGGSHLRRLIRRGRTPVFGRSDRVGAYPLELPFRIFPAHALRNPPPTPRRSAGPLRTGSEGSAHAISTKPRRTVSRAHIVTPSVTGTGYRVTHS